MKLTKTLLFSCCFILSGIETIQAEPDNDYRISDQSIQITESSIPSCKTENSPGRKRITHVSKNGSKYIETEIEGYTLMIADSIYTKDYTIKMLHLLKSSFKEVNKYLLKEYTDVIKQSPIWLEQRNDMGVAAYHPSVEWLRSHNKNEEFAHCVQCANTKNGVDYINNNQPYMFLHEMAHLVHHLVLGYENKLVINAYENAVKNHLYENILYYCNGKFSVRKQAYCLNNCKEYFSELTEAYFGVNDFYPFTREQLREYDPIGFAMMESIWKQSEKYASNRQKNFIRKNYNKRTNDLIQEEGK